VVREIPSRRSLESYAVREILLYMGTREILLHSRVPMERVFDGMDQENSKTQEGKKNGGNKKKRFFST
jgi:hypothetical protein